jgi:S1-C subfamily serine protease
MSVDRRNDVILAVDRRPIMEKADLYAVLTKGKIGRPTQVDVLRGDSIVQLTVVPTKLANPRRS